MCNVCNTHCAHTTYHTPCVLTINSIAFSFFRFSFLRFFFVFHLQFVVVFLCVVQLILYRSILFVKYNFSFCFIFRSTFFSLASHYADSRISQCRKCMCECAVSYVFFFPYCLCLIINALFKPMQSVYKYISFKFHSILYSFFLFSYVRSLIF